MTLHSDDFRRLYYAIERALVTACVIKKHSSDLIVRRGTNKQHLWRRHVIDLCSFALNQMTINATGTPPLRTLCENGITLAKANTHETGSEPTSN